MRAGVYAHPSDFADLETVGGPATLRDLGFADVAFASAYHAGRWLTPQSTHGRVRFLEDGVVHFRPGEGYGELRPQAGREVPAQGESPLEHAVRACREAGLRSDAWTVLFHNTRLGELHPGSCVRNAFGDVYTYALCPARTEVRDYGVNLLADLATLGFDVLELEAAGFMGHKHGSHHDKSSFAGDRAFDFLMSYCFCGACRAGLAVQGVDPDAVRRQVILLVQARLEDAMAFEPLAEPLQRVVADLGEEAVRAMLRHRRDVNRGFLASVRERVTTPLALHVEPDPFFTGSQMGQPFDDVRDLVDELIVTHYGQGPQQIAAAWAGHSIDGVAVRGAIWPKAPQFTGEADVAAAAQTLRAHGCDGVRVYHLGLLPWRTIERVAAVLAAD